MTDDRAASAGRGGEGSAESFLGWERSGSVWGQLQVSG